MPAQQLSCVIARTHYYTLKSLCYIMFKES